VRVTSDMGRQEMKDGCLLAARVLPARRRVRRMAWIALAAMVPLVALTGTALLPLVAGITCAAGLVASNRLWAWSLARKAVKHSPDETVHFRIDADGLGVVRGGRTGTNDWSTVTRVIEGERAVVFVVLERGMHSQFVPVPAATLTPEDRAAIRRWSDAVPGERPWTVVPGQRSSRRLTISPVPPG